MFRWSHREPRAAGTTVETEQLSSAIQEIDASCHCINWLSETSCEGKAGNCREVRGRVTMMEGWKGGEDGARVKREEVVR